MENENLEQLQLEDPHVSVETVGGPRIPKWLLGLIGMGLLTLYLLLSRDKQASDVILTKEPPTPLPTPSILVYIDGPHCVLDGKQIISAGWYLSGSVVPPQPVMSISENGLEFPLSIWGESQYSHQVTVTAQLENGGTLTKVLTLGPVIDPFGCVSVNK